MLGCYRNVSSHKEHNMPLGPCNTASHQLPTKTGVARSQSKRVQCTFGPLGGSCESTMGRKGEMIHHGEGLIHGKFDCTVVSCFKSKPAPFSAELGIKMRAVGTGGWLLPHMGCSATGCSELIGASPPTYSRQLFIQILGCERLPEISSYSPDTPCMPYTALETALIAQI